MELAVAVRNASEFTGRVPLLVAPHLLQKLAHCRYELSTDVPALTLLIKMDPALCFKAMHLHRCMARTTPPTGPAGIDAAVAYIGMAGIDTILAQTLADQVLDDTHSQRGLALEWLWRQALTTAMLAQGLASATESCSPEQAYLAGLLAGIGKLALLARTPVECTPMLTDPVQAIYLLEAEEQVVGSSQNRIGAYLIREFTHAWFAADAAMFHTASESQIGQALPLVQIVWSASRLALDPGAPSSSPQAVAALLGIDRHQIDHMVQAVEAQVQSVDKEIGVIHGEFPPIHSTADHPSPLLQITQVRTALSSVYQELLHADDHTAVRRVLQQSLCAFLGIEALMIFDHDPHEGCLVGRYAAGTTAPQAVKQIRIPLTASDCLPAKCHTGEIMVDSYSRAQQNRLTIIDQQLLAVMGTDGMLGLPIHADSGRGCLFVGIHGSDWPWDPKRQSLLAALTTAVGEALARVGSRTERAIAPLRAQEEHIAPRTRKIVHEINNPLNIITNYLKVLARRIDQNLPVDNHIRIIHEEIRRVGTLVRSLTSPGEKVADGRKNVDVNATIKDIVSLFQEGLPEGADLSIDQDLDPSIPVVEADPNLLKQALVNLLKNATEAMPAGGTITVKTRMLLGMARHADGQLETQAVKISVCDDGPGIDVELRNRLFTPHVTTKAGHDGLGLAVVKETVTHLNGTLQCESGPGRGACFHIEIPAVKNES